MENVKKSRVKQLEEKLEELSSQRSQIVSVLLPINSWKCLEKFFISPDTLEVDFFKTSKTQEKSPSETPIPPAFQKARNLKII
ncbi:hypothetical protein DU53_12060 [Kosmotoga sp. DU53]|nr:hypothetical protein DU53_12060 [Kosmotoga sp. DU53]